MTEPRVGRMAFALGVAGLLPQLALLAAIIVDPGAAYGLPVMAAYGYASLILSFLGGVWWGFAMKREAGQGALAALAVLPSLAPFALVGVAATDDWRAAFVLLGLAIVSTLAVDRRLVATGEAPPNWLHLRVPLSIGLGLLTIAIGLIARP